jgi:hypothetical protein
MTDKIARVWNGTEWVSVSSPVGVPNSIAVYQQEPPLSPVPGQLWVDSDNDQTGNYFVSSTVDIGLLVTEIDDVQTQIDSISTDLLTINSELDLKSPISSPTFTGTPAAPTATSGTNTTQLATTAFVTTADDLKANIASPTFTGSASIPTLTVTTKLITEETLTVALSDETTSITTGVAKITMRAPFAMTLTSIPRASLSIVSTSGLPTVDINVNGTSILGVNKLTIDANEKTSTTAATPTTIVTSSIADDAEITMDIDVAGTAAKGLKITLYYKRT